MACWFDKLKVALEETGDKLASVFCTLSTEELKEQFDDGFGCTEGKPFTAWGDKFVYFPIEYDGAEDIGYAPRNPCDIPTRHW